MENFFIATGVLVGIYIALKWIAARYIKSHLVDDNNPYITEAGFCADQCGNREMKEGSYERTMKPMLDHALSFAGLIMLSPLWGIIALAIMLDDPGPVFFSQKRIGKDKHYILIHKFRSMKANAPHDIPTHKLANPEQYITRVGKVLRKTSLDELPQIWDIFCGQMSIIGPRPALWNQDDLMAERDKYGANSILPGLTGLAQIRGRDELDICHKAKLDGEYTAILRKGGVSAFIQDVKCFLGTIKSVLHREGIVEGGTGVACIIEPGILSDIEFDEYGYHKHFSIDKTVKKSVLITGADSYIGKSFTEYCAEHYPSITTETIDMKNPFWKKSAFGGFDCVFHVAGMAHVDVGSISVSKREEYYAVNRDLAIETCRKAKEEGVKQFIFMSSMIIYGNSESIGRQKVVDERTVPNPSDFYGDSKWQADKGVRELGGQGFRVAVLRSPMIYGKGSKGNYYTLSKMARSLPVFPDIENQRSMLYIENLCEFVAMLVLSGEGGIYFPQNGEYSRTSQLVKLIGMAVHKPVWCLKMLNPVVAIAGRMQGKVGKLVQKAFGNNIYSQKLSVYEGLDYQKVSLKESIRRTEGAGIKRENINSTNKNQLHVLIISQYFYPETFRINDMAVEWVKRGYKVTVLTGIPNYPEGKFFNGYDCTHHRKEKWNGVEIIRIPLIPRGNSAIGMVANYCSFVVSGWFWKTMSKIKADLVFTFEVSPMTQALIGCWYSRKRRIPHFLYITDLWPENVESVTGIRNKIVIGSIQKMADYIYHHSDRILTCSKSFIEPIKERGIDKSKLEFWPQYAEEFYKPMEQSGGLLLQDGVFNFVFAGNVGYAQGLDILVEAAQKLKGQDMVVRFNIIGDGRYLCELREKIQKLSVDKYFYFVPRQPAEEIPKYLAFADALLITLARNDVFSITLPAKTQSCFACGKPILVSADGEIQNVVKEAGCGLCSDAEDVDGFVANIRKLLSMNITEREQMASCALVYAQEHFNKEKQMNRMDEIFQGSKKTEEWL